MSKRMQGPDIEIVNTPQHFINFMERRTAGLIIAWARMNDGRSLNMLAVSCYSQGVEDCMRTIEKPQPITDFQI